MRLYLDVNTFRRGLSLDFFLRWRNLSPFFTTTGDGILLAPQTRFPPHLAQRDRLLFFRGRCGPRGVRSCVRDRRRTAVSFPTIIALGDSVYGPLSKASVRGVLLRSIFYSNEAWFFLLPG